MSKLPPTTMTPNARVFRRMVSQDSQDSHDDETAASAGAPNASGFRRVVSHDLPPQLPSSDDDDEEDVSTEMTAPSGRTISHVSVAVLQSQFCLPIGGGGFDVVAPVRLPPPPPRLNVFDSARAARFRRRQINIDTVPNDRVAQGPREFRREDEGQPCLEDDINRGLVALASSGAPSPVPPLPSSQDNNAPTSYGDEHYLRHTPDRAAMRRNISRIVARRLLPTDVSRRLRRTPFSGRWVAAVESCLYKTSASVEDYADGATLERRVAVVGAAVARRAMTTSMRDRQPHV